MALRSVTDISENDLVIFLHTIIVLHRSKSPNSDDAMQVDVEPSSSNSLSTPSLPTALSLCITYPTSTPSLRLALRTHLKEVEEIDSLFEVLLGWLDKWCEKEEKFLPDDVENNEHGVPIPIGIQSSDGEDLPPLDKVRSTRVIYSSPLFDTESHDTYRPAYLDIILLANSH